MNRWIVGVTLGIVLWTGGWLLAEPAEKAASSHPPLLEELVRRVEQLQKQQEVLSQKVDRIEENQRLILQELEHIRMRV